MKTTQTNSLQQKGFKIGSQVGSVQNWIMGANDTIPVVGKGATILSWSDRSAYEVMSVSNDLKTVVIQRYNSKRIDKNGPHTESQIYEYTSLSGYDETIIFKNGVWKRKSTSIVFEKEFYEEFEKYCLQQQEILGKNYSFNKVREEYFTGLLNEHGDVVNVVKGKTKLKNNYSRISILFGHKDEYRDPTF